MGSFSVVGSGVGIPTAGLLGPSPPPDTEAPHPSGIQPLSSIRPRFLVLSSLVTMDTVEKAPLPTEADRWRSGSEQMNDREGTGDLVSSPCALSYLQKGFEGDVSL